jgi:hypothetical protein
VRRYAQSAKLPLSIVTDFEEFAVYDCHIKPDQNDNAGKVHIKYLYLAAICRIQVLAKNIALRNTISMLELNDCVQRTIDYIIFCALPKTAASKNTEA